MDENKFNNVINDNDGYYLLKYCYDNLREEQKDIAFNNAYFNNAYFNNACKYYCDEKLTEEQIKIIKMKNKE